MMSEQRACAPRSKRITFAARALTGTAIVALFVGIAGVPAFADTGVTTASQSTTANVAVTDGITLSALPASFTMTGQPGQTVTTATPVTMNVLTNHAAGYKVTVASAADVLSPATSNGDTIPIANLKVRETGALSFTSVPGPTATGSVQTHTQAARSGANGDTISNDFQVLIPNVAPTTYSAVLNYVATVL